MMDRKQHVIRARCNSKLFEVVRNVAAAHGTTHSGALRLIVRDFGRRLAKYNAAGGQQTKRQEAT